MSSSTSDECAGSKPEEQHGSSISIGCGWVAFSPEIQTRIHAALCLGVEVLFDLPEQDRPWMTWNRDWKGYPFEAATVYGKIYYDPQGRRPAYILMDGQSCEVYQREVGGLQLQEVIAREWAAMERLDLYIDLHDGQMAFKEVVSHINRGAYRSRLRGWVCDKGNTAYWGEQGGEVLVRVYDKARERAERLGLGDREEAQPWLRIEVQFRRHKAQQMAREIGIQKSLGRAIKGVLKGLLTLLIKSRTDKDKRRWPVDPKWRRIMQGVGTIKLAASPRKSSSDVTLEAKERSLRKQGGTRMALAFQNKGFVSIVDMIADGQGRLTPEQLQLLPPERRRKDLTREELIEEILAELHAAQEDEKIIAFEEASKRLSISRTGNQESV